MSSRAKRGFEVHIVVTSLETTFWAEDEHQSKVTEEPGWDDIVRAIKHLNADTNDGVILNSSNGSYMGIVGGREGNFVVAGQARDGKPFILTNGQPAGNWIAVNVGGQENEYADNEVVSLETALEVAHTFFDCGECDRRYQWKNRAAKMLE